MQFMTIEFGPYFKNFKGVFAASILCLATAIPSISMAATDPQVPTPEVVIVRVAIPDQGLAWQLKLIPKP